MKTIEATDVALDCETLSTQPNAAVIAIGACAFNRHTGLLHPTPFYAQIKLSSAMRSGHVSGDTLAWWMQQEDAARALFKQSEQHEDLSTALLSFASWWRALPADVFPWGNGATAEVTWLESAFLNGTVGLKCPWQFWKIRDQRTIVDLAYELIGWGAGGIPFRGTKHNARDDAIHQAEVIAAAFKALRDAVESKPAKDLTAVVKGKVAKNKAALAAAAVEDDEDL